MIDSLRAVVAHARLVPADERVRLAARLRATPLLGSVLVETCHRVELYADATALSALDGEQLPPGTQRLTGEPVARHLLRLALGLDSVVLAEDQLLHQLRTAVQHSRSQASLPPGLDRLFDLSLRAGRRARSWLPARRRSLADVALDRVLGGRAARPGRVLVVGAGDMGRRAAQSLSVRGATLFIASRSPERATVLAAQLSVRSAPFDPGPERLGDLDGVVVALSGEWRLADASLSALRATAGWVIDLSAPPAVPATLVSALGARLISIDDLAHLGDGGPSARLVERLDALQEQTLADYRQWADGEARRVAARALAQKAADVRSAELHALWQRIPALDPEQREEVERMAQKLTERLLRDPLERLHDDRDGRHATAARELFRL